MLEQEVFQQCLERRLKSVAYARYKSRRLDMTLERLHGRSNERLMTTVDSQIGKKPSIDLYLIENGPLSSC